MKKKTDQGFPKQLLISLNNTCQYRCEFCAYGRKKHSKTLSSLKWKGLLKEAYTHGYRDLEIGGQGEPALFKGFSGIVTCAHGLGFRIKLLSNIQAKRAIIPVLPRLAELTINMNALDEGQFQGIHRPAKRLSFDRALSCLAACVSAKAQARVNISYVVHKKNFYQAPEFPRGLFDILRDRFSIRKPIVINYHHMLIVPWNYALCPDQKDLKKMVQILELARGNVFLRTFTNIEDFFEQTKRLLRFRALIGPLTQNSFPDNGNFLVAKKLSGRLGCSAHQDMTFIDCNGDVFGCYNPTRMIYGLPAREDQMYYGNVLKASFDELLDRQKDKALFRPDLTQRFWKPCIICGLKTA
ncbi:MAG: SPASM domain-containing protein [Candidatus Omnitrophica bacterium]|nr:SPASM domain-containing protein [Candidatus Omnitrophota bacterium]